MANHASALKRNRQNEKRRVLNKMNRQKLRTQMRKMKAAIASGNTEDSSRLLPTTYSLIDKSVQKGVITKNAARRYKSRLTLQANQITA